MKNKILGVLRSALPSLISILIGLVVAVIILLITEPANAVEGLTKMLKGPFNYGWKLGLGNMLYYATPVMMTGLSVAFAYKTGLFNIGASGQYFVGAFAAILTGAKLSGIIPNSFLWIVCLLASMVAGALWASVVGFLKAWRNVSEVISSIMMNYIGMYLVLYLIPATGVFNAAKNETIRLSTSIPRFGLRSIFRGSFVDGGIIIGIIVAILIYILIEKTTFGYELKAVGLNRNAAKYAGINEFRAIVLSMVIAGALSGLGGGITYLASTGKSIEIIAKIPAEGFNGIAVALLGMSNPLAVIFSSMFIAYLNLGGQSMQVIGYVPEIISMMIGIILYVSSLSILFRNIIAKIQSKKKKNLKKEEA